MKNLYFTIFLFLTTLNMLGQKTVTIFLDDQNKKTDSLSATSKRTAIINDGIYTLIDKTISGETLNYCEYKSLQPIIEHGQAVHYRFPNEIYSKGNYRDGNLTGIWYYYQDNQIIDSADYTLASNYDKNTDCDISNFAKENGKTKKLIEDINKSLEAYLFSEYISPARTLNDLESFVMEIFFTINVDGKISCIEFQESLHKDIDFELIRLLKNFKYKGEIKEPLSMTCTFDTNDEVFVIVEEMPTFKGGDLNVFRAYVAENLKYPEEAAKNKIDGRVFVQFVVDRNGFVKDVFVVHGAHPALDAEAVRVIKNSPRWTPGKQRGKNVSVQFTFPVVFLIQ